MEGLKNKVAIVTGGATKIGAAVVRAFQRAGTKVAIADIDDDGFGRVSGEIPVDVLHGRLSVQRRRRHAEILHRLPDQWRAAIG